MSADVNTAMLAQIGHLARFLAPWGTALSAAQTSDTALPAPARVALSAASRWMRAAELAIWAATDRRSPTAVGHRLLRAIPANVAPTRHAPSGKEPPLALSSGITTTAERLRHLAQARNSHPNGADTGSAKSWQRTAHGAAISGHCSELLLRSLADHAEQAATTPTMGAALREAADASANAWQAWRTVAHAWDTITTPGDTRVTAAAAELSDLILRIGRLAYGDPRWAPGRGPASLADVGALVVQNDATVAALCAIHEAADALACIAAFDREAVQLAAGRNRLLVPTRLLPAYYDVPYRYARLAASMADDLLSAYDAAVTAATGAATALDRIAVELNSPTSVLAVIRSANLAESPHLLQRGEALVEQAAIRPWPREIERTGRSLGITDPALLAHAADVDSAVHDVIDDAISKSRRQDTAARVPSGVSGTNKAAHHAARIAARDISATASAVERHRGSPAKSLDTQAITRRSSAPSRR